MALFPLQEGGSMTIINSGVFSAGGGGATTVQCEVFVRGTNFELFKYTLGADNIPTSKELFATFNGTTSSYQSFGIYELEIGGIYGHRAHPLGDVTFNVYTNSNIPSLSTKSGYLTITFFGYEYDRTCAFIASPNITKIYIEYYDE